MNRTAPSDAPDHPVGVLTLKHFHLQEHGPAPASAWYPAQAPGLGRPGRYAKVFAKQATQGAPFAEGLPKAPLVLLMHGLRGTQYDLSWLGERLARRGLVCVAFEQPQVSFQTFDAAVAPRLWQRADALRAALDWVLVHGILRGMVHADRVLVAGHSAGASAGLVAVGAQVSPERFVARYPHSGPVPATKPADRRIGAVLGLAAGTGEVFDDAGMAQVRTPVLLYSGTRDFFCPDARNSARYAAAIPDCEWHSLRNAGHFTFKPCCSWYGKLRAPQICVDGWGVRRAALHEQIAEQTLDFLARRGLR